MSKGHCKDSVVAENATRHSESGTQLTAWGNVLLVTYDFDIHFRSASSKV